jgi:hypothetical protein
VLSKGFFCTLPSSSRLPAEFGCRDNVGFAMFPMARPEAFCDAIIAAIITVMRSPYAAAARALPVPNVVTSSCNVLCRRVTNRVLSGDDVGIAASDHFAGIPMARLPRGRQGRKRGLPRAAVTIGNAAPALAYFMPDRHAGRAHG